MAVQKASGEENLRADPSVKHGSATASPSGAGKDAGGTANLKANPQTKMSRDLKPASPAQRSIDIPRGVQSFDDDNV